MLAGPMERKRKLASSGFDDRLIIATVSRRITFPWAALCAMGITAVTTTADRIERDRLMRRTVTSSGERGSGQFVVVGRCAARRRAGPLRLDAVPTLRTLLPFGYLNRSPFGYLQMPTALTPNQRAEVVRGTLEMLSLKLLSTEPMHGWGLSLKLREISRDVFDVNQGSLYPALQAMLRRGWIKAEWRASENNRRARYYRITAEGRLATRRRDGRVEPHVGRSEPRSPLRIPWILRSPPWLGITKSHRRPPRCSAAGIKTPK